ncbi:MAG TPA: SGNH/GDSL hydrolase family protein, partial [Candidatus Acidoferrum sp.]|nr:SGNH/GDSL hydrolase family protein [Candidatus Acidoferrum sp.]
GNIPGPQPVQNQTLREKLRISVGGDKVRIRLSNEIGTKPLKIGSASIALAKGESAIDAGSLHKLTFSGADSIVIPPGAPALSDPIDLKVADLAELAISLYLPEQTAPETLHGGRTAYVSTAGDFTKADALQGAKLGTDMLFLTAVYVSRSDQPAVLVTFGDSITDGTASTPHAYASWPDDLAKLLSTGAKGRRVAVVNEGISGNQVLQDGAGVSALARFDRDVLSQPGLTHIVVLEGINDIGISGLSFGPNAPASPIRTAAELIAGHRQLIARAHARGIKIYGATLTPFAGVQGGYYSPEKDVVRGELNKWIRESKEYDGVIDFDAATRDPAKPDTMLQMYNSGDKLHPGDAGYKHMAEGIDPALFK